MARRMAWPSWKQRRPLGTGDCTTLTAKGMTGQGQARGWPHISDSGTVRPWSTSILLTMVRAKSCCITDCAMCSASSGWPVTGGPGRGPRAFAGRLELGCRADGKGRNHLQAECRGVVVVDQQDHVGPVLPEPLPGQVVAGKQRLPVVLLCLALVDGGADGRDMGAEDRSADPGLGRARAGWLRRRRGLRPGCAVFSGPPQAVGR